MDEIRSAETVKATADTAVTTDAVAEAFDAGWGSDGFTGFDHYANDMTDDAISDENDEADQLDETNADDITHEADETAAPDTTTEEQTKDANSSADQRFTLKHLDETREVNRDEVIALAQKGMDYDRKTTKQANKIAEYEAFLDELAAPSGLTRDQLMDSVRAQMFRESEKAAGREISESEAVFKIQQLRVEKAEQEQRAAEQAEQIRTAEAARKNTEMLQRFASAYPDVKATDIPQSVWAESHKTGDLLSAYVRYENAGLRRRLETMENSATNAKRSTGSMKSAGAPTPKDAFDEGWDSI